MRHFVVFAVAAVVLAQEANQGTITGFVYDSSQSTIPNAEISVTSQATGRLRTARASSEGVYTILALEPGMYNLMVYADNGFLGATGFQLR